MVHIIIVEQHVLFRLGLASLMSCLIASERIKSQSHDDLYKSSPHSGAKNIVLLGARPEDRIKLLIQSVRRIYAPKRILLFSEEPSCPISWGATPPVVAGYLSTRSNAETILSAVHSLVLKYTSRVGRSPAVVPPIPEPAPLHQADAAAPISFSPNEPELLGLSARQYEMLVLLAQGLPIKRICRQMDITLGTAKGHIEAVYHRLGAHSRNEAVFLAMAKGAQLRMHEQAEPRPEPEPES